MRVLITTSTFPVREGDGQARFVLDLATALSPHCSVQVLAPHAPGAAVDEEIERVKVRRFRYFLPTSLEQLSYGSGMRHNLEARWLARLQVPVLVVAQVLATLRTVISQRPDVINAHWLVPQGLTSAVVARLLRVPMALHVHAADVYFLRRFRVGQAIARFVVRSSSIVFADGSHVRDSLNEMLGFDSGAVLRPMGVWLDLFQSLGGIPKDSAVGARPRHFVLFVGRLVEKKGVEFLIRAMAQVRESLHEMELVIVGSGPLGDELIGLADALDLTNVVHFLGALDHASVAVLLHEADVACVPSVIDSRGETDGMPTIVLEAMASGARVVGTRVDGIPDVLEHAKNGWLAEPADEASLAAGIVAAVTDLSGDKISGEGFRRASRHDWSVVGVEYARALQEAVTGSASN